MTTSNKTTTQARDTQVIAGIQKDLKNASNLALAGGTYTTATLIALFQSRIDAAAAAAAARANWLATVAAYDALNTHVHEVEMGLKQHVFNVFGKTSPQLADFGFSPPKRATQTVEQKQLAVDRRKATRKARNTQSKKAKSKIHGTVPDPAQPTTKTAPETTTTPTAPTVHLVVTPLPPPAPGPTEPPKS